jgi:chromosome segregation ATPase
MATVFSDGLGVIIENSELVIGGISGIATGMAVFKAGSAIQTGMDLAIKGWEGYKTATEGATIAQYALNTAQKLNPVGALAIAIGILTTAVIACSTHSKAATTDTERLNEKIKDTSEKSKELKEEIKKSNEEFANSAKEVKTNYGAIQVLSDKLYTLAEKENKTNSEKAKMKLLVNELNKSIPDLNLVMDEQTGIINKQKTETESLIESMKKKAIAQVYEARYLELANEQVKAQDNLTAAIDAQTEARNGYNEALKEQKELQDQQTRSDIDWDAVHKAQENVDKYKESLKNAKTEVKSANDTLEKCNDKFNKLDGQVETSTDSVKEFGNTMENAGDQTVKTNDKAQKAIKELTKTYNQAVKDRTKEIKSAMGLFDEFAIDTKVSGEKLMKNLKSQIDGMKDWAKNLQSLAKKGVSEGLLKELEDMGPEAASQIKALNKLSDKELKEYVAMWKEKSKLARKQAKEELSGLKEDTDKKINELTKSVESKLTTSGKNSAEGFTVGFLKQKIFMETSVGSALDDLVNSANKKLGIHSPSTVFAKMGYHSAEGYALGIKNGKNMIKKSLEEVGQEIELKFLLFSLIFCE